MDLWTIVLAGGRGTRLEAVTARFEGEPIPKQFCAFGGDRTLLQRTVDRAATVGPAHRICVVVAEREADRARRQLRDRPGAVLLPQPSDRGTAAGILYPLSRILEADPGARVLVLPSDHAFGDEAGFRGGVLAAARSSLPIVLLGAAADAPRSDYGWILPGAPAGPRIYRVQGFVEKPTPDEAKELLLRGAFWSTMVLFAQGAALSDLFRRRRPDLFAFFSRYLEEPAESREGFLREGHSSLEPTDFSRGVLMGAEGLFAYAWPPSVGWCDLGTPERLYRWVGARPEEAPA